MKNKKLRKAVYDEEICCHAGYQFDFALNHGQLHDQVFNSIKQIVGEQ